MKHHTTYFVGIIQTVYIAAGVLYQVFQHNYSSARTHAIASCMKLADNTFPADRRRSVPNSSLALNALFGTHAHLLIHSIALTVKNPFAQLKTYRGYYIQRLLIAVMCCLLSTRDILVTFAVPYCSMH